MTEPTRPPVGRYGPPPDARRRRLAVGGLWALGAVGTAGALWLGVGAALTPVTWSDVGFDLRGADEVAVTFEVARRDAADAVVCRVEALNERYAQVGVLDVDVPAGGPAVQRLQVTVRTSEQAVTGIVDTCEVVPG
ncbi:DUF4307 domain-containing protein [Cellulomonas carbonis]|uniref:TetR family transcriptional regulator n=1 Tax=Cellulomonas carbonis T26 TaxID=947969 RepID=A0A0A0BWW9_9CELL|nr:DUF4307 domain-containing protein [Cellulomonas carbonis]KGM12470.1 TetR family transcriptional regulator [Cellulomonas carbonis T26]GGC15562.1 hypothetical protein GCM10010972_31040 [Cellulomonas carbonis]